MAVQNQRLQSSQQQQHQQHQQQRSAIVKAPTTTKEITPTTMPSKSAAAAAATAAQASTTTTTTTSNGGPRVSFNRDVHVKRIGKHPDDTTNYETTNLQPPQKSTIIGTNNTTPGAPPYHQLPADLNADSIRREAALVLAQADRHKSIAENGDNLPTFRVKTKRSHSDTQNSNSKKFNSLPTRKKRTPGKPVTRSASDATAAKKPNNKRPSIFNIFSRKSDSSINQSERDPRFEDSGGRRLVRSKSDVGSNDRKVKSKQTTSKDKDKDSKQSLSGSNKQLFSSSHTPLSPIIEQAQKEDFFAEQFNRERRKSDAITEQEKNESGLKELLARSRLQAEVDGPLLAQTRNTSSISQGIKNKIRDLQSKSNENMHSSQLPAQKLPLTKGVTVNGMVKRLSMERFSPPPIITSPGFSYIRPNEGITYAQLEHSDDNSPQHFNQSTTLPRNERVRVPFRETREREYRSPLRVLRSPNMEDERNDRFTSQNNFKNTATYNNHNSGLSNTLDHTPSKIRAQRDAAFGPTTVRISNAHSPSPWQQLSPRNLSDEDEGLGFETRKHFDEDLPKPFCKSPAEPPIVPVIRSITPTIENDYNHHATTRAYLSPAHEDPVDDLGYRRSQLESRILTRSFGDNAATLGRKGYTNGHNNHASPERNRDIHVESTNSHHRYLSPEREKLAPYAMRFHKPETKEILHKYSPERSHLDIIAPTSSQTMPRVEKTSRYRHTRYYNDENGDGGVKEVYERDTHVDAQGKPHVRESRYRELDSSVERQQLTDYEPKSLDSQFTSTDQYRSSPEHIKPHHHHHHHQQQQQQSDEFWNTSSLKRNKLQQRSFDKGDSGIENDFRKESFNGGEHVNRWRRRSPIDDMSACESFLKKERRHTEQQYMAPLRKNDYIYRERSIDDGSHFDPHLDKYPLSSHRGHSTLQRRDQHCQTTSQIQDNTLKRNKKLGGFEKVKQLFTGGHGGGGSSGSSNHSSKKDHARTNSFTSSSVQTPSKDQDNNKANNKEKGKYMVKEEEMRLRYREHRGNFQHHDQAMQDPKPTDISMRRRLSTPKASPLLLKRSSSDKPAKKKESPLAKTEKTSWFKSLDRRSKSKSKEKLNAIESTTSTLKRGKASNLRGASVPPHTTTQTKSLRFFGDTDLDSNPPTISRAHTTLKSRPNASSTLNRSQKYSQSAYNLDRMNDSVPNKHDEDYRRSLSTTQHNSQTARQKSSSLHNLDSGGGADEVDFRKRRHFSRSRDLHDISESGSETEEQNSRSNGVNSGGIRTLSRERLDGNSRYDENSYRQATPMGKSSSRDTNSMQRRAHMTGPPKPARSAERRSALNSFSRERERFPGESSGTEGESSLHSQRSIVYLHATTVGAIPQPYHLRRRTMSREELRSNKGKGLGPAPAPPIQPMTRTVSRSVSLLAPWKPKLVSEGYEINYSQEQNKRTTTLPHKSQMNGGTSGNSSTLTRNGNKKTETLRRIKDDQSSLRNSSITSASKSMLSSKIK